MAGLLVIMRCISKIQTGVGWAGTVGVFIGWYNVVCVKVQRLRRANVLAACAAMPVSYNSGFLYSFSLALGLKIMAALACSLYHSPAYNGRTSFPYDSG